MARLTSPLPVYAPISYAARLQRLKDEADSTLLSFEDEFEDPLSLENLGFVDPLSSAKFVATEEGNHRPPTGESISDAADNITNRFDWAEETKELKEEVTTVFEQEKANAAERGDGEGASFNGDCRSDVTGEGSGEAGTGGSSSNDFSKPQPMDIDEPEWNREGDCAALPPWKVQKQDWR